jgi:hypothetical protein
MTAVHKYFFAPRAKSFWQPIGRYVFTFGLLEKDIDEAVTTLLEINHQLMGQMAMSQINSVNAKIKLLPALTRVATIDGTKIKEMKDLTTKLEDQSTFRNYLVHGPWTGYMHPSKEREAGWQKFRISNRFKSFFWKVTVSEINSHSDELENLSEALQRLISSVCADRAAGRVPSPDKLLELSVGE